MILLNNTEFWFNWFFLERNLSLTTNKIWLSMFEIRCMFIFWWNGIFDWISVMFLLFIEYLTFQYNKVSTKLLIEKDRSLNFYHMVFINILVPNGIRLLIILVPLIYTYSLNWYLITRTWEYKTSCSEVKWEQINLFPNLSIIHLLTLTQQNILNFAYVFKRYWSHL